MKIIKVIFDDMAINSGTWDVGGTDSLGLVRIELVGWLVEDRSDCIVVAKEYQPGERQWRHISIIPKVTILEVTNLRK